MAYKALDVKTVGDVKGHFYIPAYQRGYRWNEEVVALLNDLKECEYPKSYCLQPVVVKEHGVKGNYELIDGQQRFTTLFLICKYIQSKHPDYKLDIELEYETRPDSLAFLNSLNYSNLAIDDSDIDSFFISSAAMLIKRWFEDNPRELNDIELKLDKKVKVIWYEVDHNENGPALFSRLNMGKIPLTNAELIKALFMCRSNGLDEDMQKEIAMQWDQIEQDLHNDQFWYFISNDSPEKYPTRIEKLFDLMANKVDEDKEKYRTFYFFSDKLQPASGFEKMNVWQHIYAFFQSLREWYNDFDLYHKVGYLVSVHNKSIRDLLLLSKNMTKSSFRGNLDEFIADSISTNKSYGDLQYTDDRDLIEKLLLLFNVESIRTKNDHSSRFPFDLHKKASWSLEHVHAQNSQGLNTKAAQLEWLTNHKKSLCSIGMAESDKLIKDIDNLILVLNSDKSKTPVGNLFTDLYQEVVEALSPQNDPEAYSHSLSNMALLCVEDNSTLNNSTFDVKRNMIISLDRTGDYIPICTRRVFLKYYTPSQDSQLHFWGQKDRDAYINEMNRVLKPYLSILNKKIEL